MQLKNYNVYFFFSVLIGITILTFFMLKPFFIPFIIAIILAHSFSPVYNKLLKWTKNGRGISAALTCILVAAVIIAPISCMVYSVVDEIQGTVSSFSGTKNGINYLIDSINSSNLFKSLDIEGVIDRDAINSFAKSFTQNSLLIVQGIYSSLANFIFAVFIMFFSLFYLLIDGGKLVKIIMKLSPLKNNYERTLIKKFNSIVHGIIKGTFVIAFIQGMIGAILFSLTGVASPILLGILMGVASIIPYIGTGFVWLPVGLIMLLTGNVVQGVAIIIVGASIIASVDNVLSPKLIGSDTQMHPLLILFSTLGGIIVFGAMGFIVGPILMSFFVVLWEIYALEFKKQLEEYN